MRLFLATTRTNHTVYGPLGGRTTSTFSRDYEKHTGSTTESVQSDPVWNRDYDEYRTDLKLHTNNKTTTGQLHEFEAWYHGPNDYNDGTHTTTDLFETQPAPTPPPAAPSFAGRHAPNEAGGGEGEGKPKPPLAIEPSDELILELQHQRAMENMPAPDDPGWVEKIPGFTPSNRKPTPEQERALAEWEAEGMASERMRRSANFDDFFWHSGVSNHMNALQGAMNTVMEAEAIAFGFVAPGGDDLDDLATSLEHVFAGQFKEAAKSAVSMIPYLGDAIRKGGKFFKYGARYGDEAVAVAKPTAVPVAETVGASNKAVSKLTGIIEKHHQLPREFAPQFKRAGLDIEDYVIPLDKGPHRLNPGGLHTNSGGNWNRVWREFFDDFPEASDKQILDHLAKMRKQFGLEE